MWTPTMGLMMVSVECPWSLAPISSVLKPSSGTLRSGSHGVRGREDIRKDELRADHLRQEGP